MSSSTVQVSPSLETKEFIDTDDEFSSNDGSAFFSFDTDDKCKVILRRSPKSKDHSVVKALLTMMFIIFASYVVYDRTQKARGRDLAISDINSLVLKLDRINLNDHPDRKRHNIFDGKETPLSLKDKIGGLAKPFISSVKSRGSDIITPEAITQQVQNRKVSETGNCGIIYYVHVAKCGGSSVEKWLQSMGAKKRNWSVAAAGLKPHSDPAVYYGWIELQKMLEDEVSRFVPKDGRWLNFHQHAYIPGILETRQNITRWRNKIEGMGCKFVLFTILREPFSRFMSHAKYFGIPTENAVSASLKYPGGVGNFMSRYLLFGACGGNEEDPLKCTGENPDMTLGRLRELYDLLDIFDIIGRIEDIDDFHEQLIGLTGLPQQPVEQHRKTVETEYSLPDDDISIIQKYGMVYDNMLYDALFGSKQGIPDVTNAELFPEEYCYAQRYPHLLESYCNNDWENCSPGRVGDIYLHFVRHGREQGLTYGCD